MRTLVIGEVEVGKGEQGEGEIHARNLSYFSRKVSAQEFQRQALVEVQRRGVENAKEVAAVMDGADWEQNFIDFHCPHYGPSKYPVLRMLERRMAKDRSAPAQTDPPKT